MTIALVLVAAYLLGSIPFAFFLARRLNGVDLRRAGSGNVGATNLMRTAGPRAALTVMTLDAAKGAAAVLLAERLGVGVAAAAGVAAVIGHIYPVWLRFCGGKGVATTFGVFAVLVPAATAVCVLGFVVTVWWTRYVSLGSIVGTSVLAPAAYVGHATMAVVWAAAFTSLVVIHRHRSNIARLQAGTERRFGQRA